MEIQATPDRREYDALGRLKPDKIASVDPRLSKQQAAHLFGSDEADVVILPVNGNYRYVVSAE